MDKVDTKLLLRTVYLTLQQYGYKRISLRNEDLNEYVPKIEKILEKNKIDDADLFIKAPVIEEYSIYKYFLVHDLCYNQLGFFNESDEIILDSPSFYIKKCRKCLEDYEDIIHQCCYAITGDIQFIHDDTIFEVLNAIKSQKNKQKSKTKE